MIKEFCDICEKEIGPHKTTTSVPYGIGKRIQIVICGLCLDKILKNGKVVEVNG